MPMPSLPDGSKFDIDRFVKRRSTLRNEFSSYRENYREIAEHFRPRRGFYLSTSEQTSGGRPDGRKRHQHIINSTVLRVAKNAASGLQAGVTSPSRPWKKLGTSQPDHLEYPGAREAYDELDRMLDYVLQVSNFYSASHTSYADYVMFGPAAMQIDEDRDEVIRCQVHPCGSWVGASNARGRINVFYRDYRLTGHEIAEKFSESNIPGSVRDEIRRDPYKRFDVHNAIEPNPYYTAGPAIGIAAFPYISVWWLKGHELDFLKVHGYHEFPVMVYRFSKSELNDAYGDAPGIDALGEAKQLQHQEEQKLRGLDMLVLPPMSAPTALRTKGVSMIPGHVTYYDGQQKVESLYNIDLPMQELRADIQEVERRLSELFFEDLFLMITQGVGRQVTAREVEERHEEKLIMLGPVLESMQDEFLDPAIDRVLNIMKRRGMWPEFPEELDGQEIKVEYVSILATAQRAVRTISMEQGLNFVGASVELLPEMLDRIDPDGLVDEYFDATGFPAKARRTIREAEERRAARAKAQQQQENMAMAGAAAQVGKDAAAINEQIQPNVLDQILGGVG